MLTQRAVDSLYFQACKLQSAATEIKLINSINFFVKPLLVLGVKLQMLQVNFMHIQSISLARWCFQRKAMR